MDRDKNLVFIRDRIRDIGSALFFSFSTNLVKLPACIVNILAIDENGGIWFLIKRPPQPIFLFDRIFSTELQFYRKGKEYHVHVYGKAYLVENKNEVPACVPLSEIEVADHLEKMVMVRVDMQRADYYEAGREKEKSGQGFIRNMFDKWFHWQKPSLSPLTIRTPAA